MTKEDIKLINEKRQLKKVIKLHKVLQDQYSTGQLSKKKYKREIEWIREKTGFES